MFWKRLFATKSIERLHKEMAEDEGRLRRALGPVALTSLGIGAIIGAGIFVMTGRVAAEDAGPAVVLSYVFAGIGCALAAFCYAEFASMVPVAGSAYTYAYATLGELFAWIIGWDLILEYAMSAATVGSAWGNYFNELTRVLFGWEIPPNWCNDPISHPGAYLNLPAVVILLLVTAILVVGIRESAASNTLLVIIKLGVVLFVICVGFGSGYVVVRNWTDVPKEERILPEQRILSSEAKEIGAESKYSDKQIRRLEELTYATYMRQRLETLIADGKISAAAAPEKRKTLEDQLSKRQQKVIKDEGIDFNMTAADEAKVKEVIAAAKAHAPEQERKSWGLLGKIGLNKVLAGVDDSTRTNYTPYGISGIMLGAALVFFAFIGFDSISTHAEEAKKPQRDVPIGILASLFVCTILYIAVSAVITGMEPYPDIDTKAAIASAFRQKAEEGGGSPMLKWSAGLIAAGGLAGMTSVLLITFLSQARVFLAMARDGFMPQRIFGTVHEKFKTPHVSTIVTGILMAGIAAFTPITKLEEMVNIGTLFAFVIVCAAVLILRRRRPDVHRPFRTPAVAIVAPVGILVNVTMMLFLPDDTWLRLIIWLVIGLVIYFTYGFWNSRLRAQAA
ncbi:MAG TPA: amino acid permease [Gemmataceae bacterium]|jgi:APA family basic amino acid/polyamine antiporter|nr:amino acid permease [Gemmataceae bacterium]